MAITAAARKSGMDVGHAVTGFYFHRLLCRIFSVPDSPFLLKGGQSMLARTPSARATRDIDLLAQETDLDEALSVGKAMPSYLRIHASQILLTGFVAAERAGGF